MLSTVNNDAVDLIRILFGDVLGESQVDLWVTVVLAAVVLGVIVVFYKESLVLTFDPVLALVLPPLATALRYLRLVHVGVNKSKAACCVLHSVRRNT